MEKLGQLVAERRWDLVVVDTPPTRSALDFLDAPARLGTFLDGRLIKILLAPARVGGKAYLKVVNAGLTAATRTVAKVIGAQLLTDLQQFVGALDTMFGGFRTRADETYAMLKAPGTAFVVVAAPEPAALREASYFADRLTAESMPLAGLVVNRVHRPAFGGLGVARALGAAETLEAGGGGSAERTTAALLRLHAERTAVADREAGLVSRFARSHPTVGVRAVPALATDVHDLAGLRTVGAALALRPG